MQCWQIVAWYDYQSEWVKSEIRPPLNLQLLINCCENDCIVYKIYICLIHTMIANYICAVPHALQYFTLHIDATCARHVSLVVC